MLTLKTPDKKLLNMCRQYMLKVEPVPKGEIYAKGIGLISGIVTGSVSKNGAILFISQGDRPSVEELALANAVIFESENPDTDLLELCRNVGLAAISGIKKIPHCEIVMDGLRGNLHLPGPVEQLSNENNLWENEIKSTLPVPVLSALNSLEDISFAKRRGAAGIGLIRSEHFCMHTKRLPLLQQLLLLDDGPLAETRGNELAESLAEDFKVIFEQAPNGPLMFRLLDPPFHEFVDYNSVQTLPNSVNFTALYQDKISIAPTLIRRGMRLNMRQPAILRVMINALDQASINQRDREVFLTLPLTTSKNEILFVKELIQNRPWKISVMLETPSAIIDAPEWFDVADHFSIGGNDLAQCFWGISRDDRQDLYYMQRQNIIDFDPFITLNKSLCTLITPFLNKTKEAGKMVNFCGQQAADVESAQFLIENGVGQLTCGIDALVPLRIQLSQVNII